MNPTVTRSRGWLLALVAASSCEAQGAARDQWTIFLGTDAPIPQMGDRLLVEIVDEQGGVCESCQRSFGVGAVSSWPISFGVISTGSLKRGVRARLVRSSQLDAEGAPMGDRYLDAFAWLPVASGDTRVSMSLQMDCFGRLSDPEAGTTCDPSTSAPATAPTLVAGDDASEDVAAPGTWQFAGPFDCGAASPPAGMVCIPGGVLLLGSPRYAMEDPDLRPTPEQLVVLDPFFLDADELTVGVVTELVAAGLVASPPEQTPVSGCTYGGDPLLPMTCIDRATAGALCAALGKRLPTEAEWEYAASNASLETRFPWLDEGSEPCAQAVVDQRHGRCRSTGEVLGPIPGGAPRDVTLLGVRNLAGNVSEWVADDFVPCSDSACWGAEPTLRVNPLCSTNGVPVVRGASWVDVPALLDVSLRSGAIAPSVSIGFRCATTAR